MCKGSCGEVCSLGAFFEPQWREVLTVVTGDLDASVGIAVTLGLAALVVAAVWRRRSGPSAASAGSGSQAVDEAKRC